MPEPGGSKVERRLPVGKRAHDARAPPDLAQRSKGEYLGSVEAPDRERAEAVAVKQSWMRTSGGPLPLRLQDNAVPSFDLTFRVVICCLRIWEPQVAA